MRAGALAKRGLGYERLAGAPASVFCAATSGFGQTGPFRDLATHGVAYDADRGPRCLPSAPRTASRPSRRTTRTSAPRPARSTPLARRARGRVRGPGPPGEGACLDVAQADAAVTWSAGALDAVMSRARAAEVAGTVPTPDPQSGGASMRVTPSGTVILRHVRRPDHPVPGVGASLLRAVLRGGRSTRSVGRRPRGGVRRAREWRPRVAARELRRDLRSYPRPAGVGSTSCSRSTSPGAPVHRVPELPEDPNFIARADVVQHDHPIAGPLRLLGTRSTSTPPRTDGAGTVDRRAQRRDPPRRSATTTSGSRPSAASGVVH